MDTCTWCRLLRRSPCSSPQLVARRGLRRPASTSSTTRPPTILGFHVSLDGEDWTDLKIFDPTGKKIFDVSAGGGYKNLGLTELFFEGAEPNLAEFPLEELLALFPEGE